jgi:ribonuclease P/MRP protein subunit POP3
VTPSKGKRARKRKRLTHGLDPAASNTQAIPPVPEISKSVDVGLSHITRNLEGSIKSMSSETEHKEPDNQSRQYTMIFVTRGDQSQAFNGHFPRMVAAASRCRSPAEKIRLVGFSKSCSEKLNLSLGIARTSSVALLGDAPGSRALFDKVRQVVPPIEAPWLEEARKEPYHGTRINAMETAIGVKRVKKGKGSTTV